MGFRDHFRSAKRSDDRASSISSSSTKSKHNTTGQTTPNNPNTTDDTSSPLKTINTSTDPSSPAITLTKSHSRLGKTLTWHTSSSTNKPSKKEASKDKQLKAWAKEDAVEWTSPMSQRPGRKDKGCQDTLRAFDFRKAALGGENEGKGRSMSGASDVSPSQSRVGSVDDGPLTLGQMRRSMEGRGPGKLSQEIEMGGERGAGEKKKMGDVREE